MISYCIRAEFLKAFAMRLPQIGYVAIFGFLFLFIYQTYHIGGMNQLLAQQGHRSMYYALGPLLFRTTDTMLFQLFILSVTVYLTLYDTRAGMTRVVCAQPLDRISLAFCRLVSIVTHAALFALVYYLSLVAWTSAYSGVAGVGFYQISRICLSCCYLMIQAASLAAMAFALSLFWRSLAAGIMGVFGSILAFVLLMMTLRPFLGAGVPPRVGQLLSGLDWRLLLPVRLLPLPERWLWIHPNEAIPVGVQFTFLASAVIAPLVVCIPAFWHFSRRDITE